MISLGYSHERKSVILANLGKTRKKIGGVGIKQEFFDLLHYTYYF